MSRSVRIWTKAGLWLVLLLPAAWAVYGTFSGEFVDPVDEVEDLTGIWTLRLLCLTLAVTPVRRLTGWNEAIHYRRLFGLFAFFYAALHFLTYLGLDLFFRFDTLAEDIAQRPFVTVGFTAFVLLVPLAATSTRGAMRKLGRRWGMLHRLVYASAVGGIVHFFWKTKADADFGEPLLYAIVVAVLLGYRFVAWALRRRRDSRRATMNDKSA
jgi:sulfoxide reductase heme-binding subunit YedZ